MPVDKLRKDEGPEWEGFCADLELTLRKDMEFHVVNQQARWMKKDKVIVDGTRKELRFGFWLAVLETLVG